MERLMSYYGAPINSYGKRYFKRWSHSKSQSRSGLEGLGDISSASFFIALSMLAKKSVVQFTELVMNQTRNAALDCITRMHGRIRRDRASETWEPTINSEVQSSELLILNAGGDVIPNIIDEIPILSVLGLSAKGTMIVRDAEELRVKESDRINSIVRLIEAMGCSINEYVDGFDLGGGQEIQPFYYDSGGDHRMAMSAIIAALTSFGKKLQ